jgi:hypothetical protein
LCVWLAEAWQVRQGVSAALVASQKRGLAMGIAERIYEEVKALPESRAAEVLDFVEFLLSKTRNATESGDSALPVREINLALFRQHRGLYDGSFDRESLYDRPGLR